MNKADVWFGDSWVIGTGLYDEIYQQDKSKTPELHYQELKHTGRFPNLTRDWSHPEYSFASLTSKERDVEYMCRRGLHETTLADLQVWVDPPMHIRQAS